MQSFHSIPNFLFVAYIDNFKIDRKPKQKTIEKHLIKIQKNKKKVWKKEENLSFYENHYKL